MKSFKIINMNDLNFYIIKQQLESILETVQSYLNVIDNICSEEVKCPTCFTTHIRKNGKTFKRQKYVCMNEKCPRSSFDI